MRHSSCETVSGGRVRHVAAHQLGDLDRLQARQRYEPGRHHTADVAEQHCRILLRLRWSQRGNQATPRHAPPKEMTQHATR